MKFDTKKAVKDLNFYFIGVLGGFVSVWVLTSDDLAHTFVGRVADKVFIFWVGIMIAWASIKEWRRNS